MRFLVQQSKACIVGVCERRPHVEPRVVAKAQAIWRQPAEMSDWHTPPVETQRNVASQSLADTKLHQLGHCDRTCLPWQKVGELFVAQGAEANADLVLAIPYALTGKRTFAQYT